MTAPLLPTDVRRAFYRAIKRLERTHSPQRVTVDELLEHFKPPMGRLYIVQMLEQLVAEDKVERCSLMHWRTK